MRNDIPTRTIALAAAAVLAGCASARPEDPDRPAGAADDIPVLSCPELADTRAAEQYEADSARFEERDSGLFQDSGLSRDFAAMDAAARRRAVREECERLRSQPADDAVPVTIDQ